VGDKLPSNDTDENIECNGFPALKSCGGFDLMKSQANSRLLILTDVELNGPLKF
jgi:hypothetical protein